MTDPNKRNNDPGADDDLVSGVRLNQESADTDSDSYNEVEKLRTELAETRDRLLRERAELDNYRKRSRRELEDSLRYASMPLTRDIVPVIDNLERALEAGKKTTNAASLLEGFRMVAQQFEDVLKKHHIVRINALGEPFDPHQHEAILQQASEEYPVNTVMGTGQTGFLLHDRVVRPAQVIVSTGKPQQ